MTTKTESHSASELAALAVSAQCYAGRGEAACLPPDWLIRPLGELYSFNNGANANKEAYGSGVPFINVLEVLTHTHIVERHIPGRVRLPKPMVDAFTVQRGDVLFNRTSETQEEVGLAAVYEDDAQVIFGGFVIRGRPIDDTFDPTYVGYGFRAPIIRRQIVAKGQGAIRANIGQAGLKSVMVPVPPKEEQRAIAAALSDVDKLIGALDKLIAKKRAIKLATMQQLLTGKTRLPGFAKDDSFKSTDAGVIPNDWDVKLLPHVCLFRSGKAHEPFISEMGDYVCVNSKFISTDGQVRKYCTANLCKARREDILMVMSDLPNGRALAKAYLVEIDDKYAVNQRVCVLTAYNDDPRFLYYILNRNRNFVKFNDGVNQTHLLNHVFAKCPVALPPSVDEQRAIGKVISDMDAEIAALEERRDKTKAIKQGMMQALLTGRVRLVEPEGGA